MSKLLTFSSPAIAASYLMAASPDAVFNWVAATAEAKKDRRRLEHVFDQQILLQLLTRGEPLIDLAIASYCDDPDALESLWKAGDRTIRLAIAGNTCRQGFAGLQSADREELCGGDDNDLRQLVFGNPSMAHGALANFLEREGNFEGLSDEAWRKCLYFALRNPILQKAAKEDRFSDDGWQDHQNSRPFAAAWRLLLILESNDVNVRILSDAYLSFAQFSPPYDDPLLGAQFAQTRNVDAPRESMEEFRKRHERGTRAFVEAMLLKWRDPPELNEKDAKDQREWPSDSGFIRQGIAAAASRQGYQKEVIAFIRDHADKWTRAGYYMAFPFRDAATLQAAYQKEPVFFVEQAVYNHALYLNTPAGRAYRSIVGNRSGKEWQHFSDDQMRRGVFYNRGMNLWKKDPTTYPHPEDDVESLHLELPKREKEESLSDYLWRRSDEMKVQTDARLEQIYRWLSAVPEEPQRVWPLIASMVATLQREMEERTTILADDQSRTRSGIASIFGEKRR